MTGTSIPAVMDVHIENNTSRPIDSDRLHGRLHDDGGAQLDRGGEHGLQREVVHDVERRDTVPIAERAVEDLSHRNDGHVASLVTRG